MALSPIATLVHLSGRDFEIKHPTAAPAYDPGDLTDFDPGAETTSTVRAVYSKITVAGIVPQRKAVLLVADTTLPAGMKSDVSSVVADGLKYTVCEIRKREYLGEHDGFTLELDV